MLFFCDFIQVYVFSTNHHLNSAVVTLENLRFLLNSDENDVRL